MKDKKIRVAVIEDDKPFRIYLESEIRKMPSCQFDYGIASLEAMKMDGFDEYNPDVLLLDMALGGVIDGGIKAIEFLKKKKRKLPKILIVSGYCDSWMIQMMKQIDGVSGCIRKSVLAMADHTFLESIINKTYQSAEFIIVLDDQQSSTMEGILATKKIVKRLTENQEEILQRLAQDQTQNDIADYMKKPVATINNTVAQLRKKFKVETTPKLLIKVKELGYLG
jgi:DNA-binding NarL/FixJ family response regulator